MDDTSRAPRRSPAFNAAIVGIIILLLVIAGVIVWNWWSLDARSAADNSRDEMVQPATLPPPSPAVPAQPKSIAPSTAQP